MASQHGELSECRRAFRAEHVLYRDLERHRDFAFVALRYGSSDMHLWRGGLRDLFRSEPVRARGRGNVRRGASSFAGLVRRSERWLSAWHETAGARRRWSRGGCRAGADRSAALTDAWFRVLDGDRQPRVVVPLAGLQLMDAAEVATTSAAAPLLPPEGRLRLLWRGGARSELTGAVVNNVRVLWPL